MARNWGRTPVTNADKRAHTETKYMVAVNGETEERIDRRPLGKVERFVDPDGGVVSLQLYGDGDARRHESEIRRRAELHRKGFVEHAKCPIKHGTRNSSTIATKDFAKMPTALAAECKHDKKAMERRDGDLYAVDACPHIEWLIAARRAKATESYRKRNEINVKRAEQAEAREAAQLEQAKALTALLDERSARKPRAKDSID